MGHNYDKQHGRETENDDVEEEEALSLSEFPLTSERDPDEKLDNPTSPSSDPTHLFEFLTPRISPTPTPAADIIFGGKLIPFNPPPPPPPPSAPSSSSPRLSKTRIQPEGKTRRSESAPESKATRREPEYPFVRPSRSLDFRQKTRSSRSNSRRSEPAAPDIDRNSSGKSAGSSSGGTKFRWGFPIFGLLKFPPEMALRDIKSRQTRRNPATLFPQVGAPPQRSSAASGKSPSWRILRALSCRDDASVAVATSFGCIPQV